MYAGKSPLREKPAAGRCEKPPLSCHIASSGKRYHSHAATIYKWAQEDAAKKAPKKGIPDYACLTECRFVGPLGLAAYAELSSMAASLMLGEWFD